MLLVLWDIDGTLVDCAGHGRHAFEEAFHAVVGRAPEPVEFAGRTDHEIALAMLGGSGRQLPLLVEELATALERRKPAIRREGRAFPGAEEALRALAAHEGVVQSLLTGNLESNAAVKLSAFGLERFVDLRVGGYGSDPHGARSDLVVVARERATASYGEPTDTVLIGDTPLDVRAAREAGARAVAVASGSYGLEELSAVRPDAVLADLRDTARVVAAVTAST